jgi:hypothetical protein
VIPLRLDRSRKLFYDNKRSEKTHIKYGESQIWKRSKINDLLKVRVIFKVEYSRRSLPMRIVSDIYNNKRNLIMGELFD